MTTNAKHTPEPWKYSVNVGPTRGLIVEEDGSTIMELRIPAHDSRFEANARRIIACVNACAGLTDSELSGIAGAYGDLRGVFKAHAECIAQRDELAAALLLAHQHMQVYLSHYQVCHNVHDAVSAALAKVQA